MTFLGDLYTKGGRIPSMKVPLGLFLAGVFLAGIATFTTYLIQLMLFNESINERDGNGLKSHIFWLYGTLFIILLSLAAFAAGSFCAVSRLQ
jgi:hypothetical protein